MTGKAIDQRETVLLASVARTYFQGTTARAVRDSQQLCYSLIQACEFGDELRFTLEEHESKADTWPARSRRTLCPCLDLDAQSPRSALDTLELPEPAVTASAIAL